MCDMQVVVPLSYLYSTTGTVDLLFHVSVAEIYRFCRVAIVQLPNVFSFVAHRAVAVSVGSVFVYPFRVGRELQMMITFLGTSEVLLGIPAF